MTSGFSVIRSRLDAKLRRVREVVVDTYRRRRYGATWSAPEGRSVPDVFSEIYRRGLWGKTDRKQPFNSGPGSAPGVAEPYVAAVCNVIDARGVTSVVDLGCGDFRVSSKIIRPALTYVGLDVVRELVDYNNRRFSSSNVTFRQANLITDELPKGQLCLVRQVLQHLSNAQVAVILEKCKRFPLVVITEHLPDPSRPWKPNVDIHHGSETRVDAGSGLVFDAPPFNLKIDRTLCEVPLADGTLLRTVLIVNDG